MFTIVRKKRVLPKWRQPKRGSCQQHLATALHPAAIISPTRVERQHKQLFILGDMTHRVVPPAQSTKNGDNVQFVASHTCPFFWNFSFAKFAANDKCRLQREGWIACDGIHTGKVKLDYMSQHRSLRITFCHTHLKLLADSSRASVSLSTTLLWNQWQLPL